MVRSAPSSPTLGLLGSVHGGACFGERLGGWPLRSIVTQRFAPDLLFVRRTVSGRMGLCCREPDGAFSLASRLQRTSVHRSLVYTF